MSQKNTQQKGLKLKIVTKGAEIDIDDIVEYVCGKQYFYVNCGPIEGVKTIDRSIILEVYRVNGSRRWLVNLKDFKEKDKPPKWKRNLSS